jgi:hypothetical protein
LTRFDPHALQVSEFAKVGMATLPVHNFAQCGIDHGQIIAEGKGTGTHGDL